MDIIQDDITNKIKSVDCFFTYLTPSFKITLPPIEEHELKGDDEGLYWKM